MTRLRIAHVIQNLNYGGMERLIGDLVRLADPVAFESHVIVLQYRGRFAAGLDEHGVVHQCAPLPKWSMLWPGPLIALLRRVNPAVVHSHSGVWYKAALAARRAGIPRVIHTEHGLRARDTWLARAVERRSARRSDLVVAVSEALAGQLAGTIVPSDRLRVVPNGVDTERYAPRPDTGTLRAALNLSADVPIIGSIGRLEPVKAYHLMIDALARLRADWREPTPPPVLVLGGDGSTRADLTSAAAAHGVADAVHLLGWRDDVHDLHSAFTLFSLSSESEGTSVSLLEAMSAGLCPVVTAVGGTPAVLGNELRHRLIPPGDAGALAAAWRVALQEPALRVVDGATARRRVQQAFGIGAMVRRYEALYRGEP